MKMLRRFARFVVRWRVPIFLVAILVTIPALVGMLRTPSQLNIYRKLPEELESIRGIQVMEEGVGAKGQAFLLIDTGVPGGAMREEVLVAERELRMRIAMVEGVGESLSASDLLIHGGMVIPIESLPLERRAMVEKLFDPERRMTWITLTLVSEHTGEEALEDFERTVGKIKEIEEAMRGSFPEGTKLYLTGEIPMMTDLERVVEEDRPKINAAVLIGVAVVVALIFLSLWVPVAIIAALGFSVLWNLGLCYLWPGELNILTLSTTFAIQLGCTVDYCVFLLGRYREERRSLPKEEAMVNALSTTSRPILGAALTTMLGFGCLAISRVGFISEFGLILSRGIFLSFLSAVMVVPALVLVSDIFLRKLSWKGFRD